MSISLHLVVATSRTPNGSLLRPTFPHLAAGLQQGKSATVLPCPKLKSVADFRLWRRRTLALSDVIPSTGTRHGATRSAKFLPRDPSPWPN